MNLRKREVAEAEIKTADKRVFAEAEIKTADKRVLKQHVVKLHVAHLASILRIIRRHIHSVLIKV